MLKDVPNDIGQSEVIAKGKSRRALSRFFRNSLGIEPASKPCQNPGDAMRLASSTDMSARDEGAPTSTGYWKSFVQAARKKSWYTSSPGDEGAKSLDKLRAQCWTQFTMSSEL